MSNPDSSYESQTIRLNCLVLGEHSNEIFEVEIAKTAKINQLKDSIKGKRPDFDKIAANFLKIWDVDLRVDDNLEEILTANDSFVQLGLPKRPQSSLAKLNDIFTKPHNEQHLHIIIERPPDVSSQWFTLNCFILGNDPDEIFKVNIVSTGTVVDLKELIKEKNKHVFDGVDAGFLKLWKANNLPINGLLKDKLNDLKLDHQEILLPVSILKVFPNPPQDTLLHIIVRPPPTAVRLTIDLNCFVLGNDPNRIVSIRLPRTNTVSVLRNVIKDAITAFCNIEAESLVLWKIDLPMDNMLERHLNDLKLDQKGALSPGLELTEVYVTSPQSNYLHIVIQSPEDDTSSGTRERTAYIQKPVPAPSNGAKPSEFNDVQTQLEYLCNRPRDAADPVPVTLLEPIFAEFVDNCDCYQPTAEDNDFIMELSKKMCSFYPNEPKRMDVFRKELCRYGIPLAAAMVGSTKCSTDGHMMSPNPDFVQVIIEGKNEIGSGDAEPFAQSLLYYRKFLQDAKDEIIRLRFIAPCLHIIVFGACVGVAGSVFTRKVQCDVLVPVIPLFWHSRDIAMQTMTARTFGALKIAINGLKERYPTILPTSPINIPIGCPYPQQYTDLTTGRQHEFLYDREQAKAHRDRLIFFGETVDGAQKICIKFVKHYSYDAHLFCANKGHAPKLIAYEHLPGGWKMVVMHVLRIDNRRLFPREPSSFRQLDKVDVSDRRLLEEPITSLIQELHKHNGGYVHGDLRDANFFLGDDTHFMLLDFDWAGPVDKTYYPMYINVKEIDRPEGVQDGKKILVEHDLYMVKRLFYPEQEGPALKRRRVLPMQ